MPKTEEQFEDIRQERKKQIIEAACELFAYEGYHTTSISQIAKKAKISKGLIYNYFESKEHILRQIILNGLDQMLQFFDSNEDRILTADEFASYIGETLLIFKSNEKFWKLYFYIMFKPDVMALLYDDIMQKIQPYITVLNKYYESKKVKNPMAHTMFLLATLDGIALNYLSAPEMFPIDEIKELIIDKFK